MIASPRNHPRHAREPILCEKYLIGCGVSIAGRSISTDGKTQVRMQHNTATSHVRTVKAADRLKGMR